MAETLQTFSESWYRISQQRLGLRPDTRVQRQNFRGQRWIVLQNPFNNQFYRLRPSAYEFVARLRPDRTVQEVWQECLNRFPDEAPGQEEVIRLLSQLYYANLLQYDSGSDSAKLFERYERTRQRQTRATFLNLMFMRIPLLDPDQFLVRTLPLVKKLISPFGAILWMVIVGLGLKVAVDHWPQLQKQSEGILAPNNLFLLYLGMVVIKALHEFGHAFFCRRYGGEVHVMGIMLMIFTPVPYMDATSSWGFRNRWQRILVGAAGMIVEVFVAALAAFVWANTGPGVVHSLAYNMMFVASVSTLIFNLNPLLRFDGYYILSDLLEIPNLHQRALQQLYYLAEKYLFGVKKLEAPTPHAREATWLTVFGITSGIYRIIVFSGILLFVADRFLLLGLIMAAVCIVSWGIAPIVKLIKYLASSPRLARNRARAIYVTGGIVAGVVLFLQVVPFPHHFRAPGVLESRRWTQVLNESPGILETILVASGSEVKSGQPLLRLKNEALELELAAAKASYEEVQARLRQAMQEQTANIKPLNSRLDSVTKKLHQLEADKDALTLRARQDGLWVAPEVKNFVGRWMPRGSQLGLVLDPSSFEFLATVQQEDGDRLYGKKIPGAEVRLVGESEAVLGIGKLQIIQAEKQRLPSAALGWKAGGDVPVTMGDQSGVQAVEPFFEVRAEVQSETEAALLHGRAGKIRFELEPEPLLPRWMRRLRQLLQKRYQL